MLKTENTNCTFQETASSKKYDFEEGLSRMQIYSMFKPKWQRMMTRSDFAGTEVGLIQKQPL